MAGPGETLGSPWPPLAIHLRLKGELKGKLKGERRQLSLRLSTFHFKWPPFLNGLS
jgi:hypothetical protein